MSVSSINLIKNKFKPFLFFIGSDYKWVEFIYPSTLLIAPVVKILVEPIKSNDSLASIELGLHEALVNAVQHGNKSNNNKILRIRRIVTSNWFIWQIQDEGEGLSKKQRRSSLPINIDSKGGRGLYLIHQCFDDVRWSQKGNRIQVASKRK